MAVETKVTFIKGCFKPLTSTEIKFIDKIGVELEGGWDNGKPDNIHTDISIRDIITDKIKEQAAITETHNCHICNRHSFITQACLDDPVICEDLQHDHCMDTCEECCDNGCPIICDCLPGKEVHIGECISDPSSIEELRSWVEHNAPDIVNKTCGLHVHISFKTQLDYVRIMDKAFYDYFLDWFTSWGKDLALPKTHEFWIRLKGDNKYCQRIFRPEQQVVRITKGENNETRRTHLNYCYNIKNPDGSPRRTMECRLFPAFSHAGYTMSAIENLVRCIETYLSTTKYNVDLYEVCSEIDESETIRIY